MLMMILMLNISIIAWYNTLANYNFHGDIEDSDNVYCTIDSDNNEHWDLTSKFFKLIKYIQNFNKTLLIGFIVL